MNSKRKKRGIILAISLSALFILLIVVRVTGILQYYKVPTFSSMPTIQQGESILTSNLVKPKRFDLICFRTTAPKMEGEHTYVFRVCGMPGDTIEVRNGDLFVNNQSADDKLNLTKVYTISSSQSEKALELAAFDEKVLEFMFMHLGDSSMVYLSGEQLKKLEAAKIPCRRYIDPNNYGIEEIKEKYNQSWNLDHFGPYIVPAKHYFVMGDNRKQSQDSRFLGPIPFEKYEGTVLNK